VPTSATLAADPIADPGVVEVPIILSAGLAAELEAAADRRGLTAAQLVRRLIRGYLTAAATADRPAELVCR